MENENKDLQNAPEELTAEERVKADISEKIAEAAENLNEVVAEAETETETEEVSSLADAVTQLEVDDEIEEIVEVVKEKKMLTMSQGKFWTSMVASLLIGALLCFSVINIPGWIANMPEGSTVVKVGDATITDLDLEFYIYSAAMTKFSEISAENPDAVAEEFDWSQTGESGKTYEEEVKEEALKNAKADAVLMSIGKKYDVAWTDEEQSQIDTAINSYVSQFGEDGFKDRVNTMGIASVKEYKKIYETMMYLSKVREEMDTNIDEFYPEGTDLNNYKMEDGASVQHILIKTVEEASDDAVPAPAPVVPEDKLAKAQSVLEQAKGGADFAQLMEQYNEDEGQTETGYTFGPGEMQPEFEAAAFALNIGEISDIVTTTFGHHIIKRIPGRFEVVGYWQDTLKIKVSDGKVNKLSISEILNRASAASEKLKAEVPAE